jgi:tetratricopeptide (TPR) repeat protein
MLQNGALDEGLDLLQKAVHYSPENALFKADLAMAYGNLKMPEEALKILSALESAQSEDYVSPYALALASLAVEDPEKTLQYLEEAFDQKDPHLIWVNEEVYFDSLRLSARFDQLIKRMRFRPNDSSS